MGHSLNLKWTRTPALTQKDRIQYNNSNNNSVTEDRTEYNNIVFSSFSVCCFVTTEWKLIGINIILEYFGLVLESVKKFWFIFHQCMMFVREMEN